MSAAGGETPIRVLLIDGSPSGAGRTATVLRGVGASAADAGAETQQVSLAGDLESVAAEVISIAGEFDAFVFGTPTYRASYTGELKFLLDRMPRGMWGRLRRRSKRNPWVWSSPERASTTSWPWARCGTYSWRSSAPW